MSQATGLLRNTVNCQMIRRLKRRTMCPVIGIRSLNKPLGVLVSHLGNDIKLIKHKFPENIFYHEVLRSHNILF